MKKMYLYIYKIILDTSSLYKYRYIYIYIIHTCNASVKCRQVRHISCADTRLYSKYIGNAAEIAIGDDMLVFLIQNSILIINTTQLL